MKMEKKSKGNKEEETNQPNDNLNDDNNAAGKDVETSKGKPNTPAKVPSTKSKDKMVSKKHKAGLDVQTRTSSKKTRGSRKK